jgi:hypothetical protein
MIRESGFFINFELFLGCAEREGVREKVRILFLYIPGKKQPS